MEIYNGTYSVYCHINKINGKKYVGQTKLEPNIRFGKNGRKYSGSRHFFFAIQKYGWDNFDHIIVANNLTIEEANSFEQLLIAKLDLTNPEYGYNIAKGGDNKEPSEETREIWRRQRSNGGSNGLKVCCDGITFVSVNKCADFYGIDRGTMKNWLNQEHNMPQRFIDLGLHYVDKPFIKYMPQVGFSGRNNPRAMKVICNGKIFGCVTDCSKFYEIPYTTMVHWLKGERPMSQRFKDMGLAYWNGGDVE